MSNGSDAVAALYRDEHRMLTAYVRRRLGSSEADDVVQDAFVKLLRSGDPARLVQPRSYLYRIALNLIVDRHRKRRRDDDSLHDDADVESVATAEHPFALDVAMRVSFLQIYLRKLPDSHRAVYLMHQVDGMTLHEIADQLDISPRTVNRMMNRAVDRLNAMRPHS